MIPSLRENAALLTLEKPIVADQAQDFLPARTEMNSKLME
jgi:hypothetical protein